MFSSLRFDTLWEGRHVFAALLVFMLLAWALRRKLSSLPFWLGVALLAFTVYFFRDPERPLSREAADPLAVLAAADGVVADIAEVQEDEVVKGRMKRVGIFLSVLDVHTNKAPIEGKVIYSQEHEGEYLDARDPAVSEKNAARTWAFQRDTARGLKLTIVVRQLTGLIARRIVGWSKVDDEVQKGERFGMIRFGSRTEVYVPLNAEITVAVGDKVQGGATVIAKLPATMAPTRAALPAAASPASSAPPASGNPFSTPAK